MKISKQTVVNTIIALFFLLNATSSLTIKRAFFTKEITFEKIGELFGQIHRRTTKSPKTFSSRYLSSFIPLANSEGRAKKEAKEKLEEVNVLLNNLKPFTPRPSTICYHLSMPTRTRDIMGLLALYEWAENKEAFKKSQKIISKKMNCLDVSLAGYTKDTIKIGPAILPAIINHQLTTEKIQVQMEELKQITRE